MYVRNIRIIGVIIELLKISNKTQNSKIIVLANN